MLAALVVLAACSTGLVGVGQEGVPASRAQQVTMDVSAIEAGMLAAHRRD